MAETAVATTQQQPSALSTMKGWLQSDAFKEAIAKALPTHMTPERFLRIALTATMRTPKLLQCTQESMFNCLLQLSQYGLEPDGRRAHLIPFENRKAGTVECTLIIDFKGLAELVMRSGLVSNIHADIVCENDDFAYDRGAIVRHQVDFRNPRGPAYAAYCVVRFKDGTEKCEVMAKDDIYAIRNASQGWIAFQKGWTKQSPWDPKQPHTEYEMWKKTVFRRTSKWVPLSAEIYQAFEREDEQQESTALSSQAVIDVTASKSDALAKMLESQSQVEDSRPEHEAEPSPEAIADALLSRISLAKSVEDLTPIAEEALTIPQVNGDPVLQAVEQRRIEIEKSQKATGKGSKQQQLVP